MWIERACEGLVQRMAEQFPAVLVTGARQVGKTSLLRRLFPEAAYVTLDYPGFSEAALTEPERLLDGFEEPVIIDEIQYVPSLLRHLKTRIDRDRRPGRFLLTGSQVFPLMAGVSESLAGRCGVVNLLTLSRAEIAAAGRPSEEDRLVFVGGYPDVHTGVDADLWFPSYVATYLERDVRNVLRVSDLQEFHRFLRVCALRNAQVLNYADLARDTGVAPNTARAWLGLLQASGVVTLAEPFFGNRSKRLIKAPKLFFQDSGLAAFLSGFRSAEGLWESPHAGAFWECYVHGQVARWYAAVGDARPIHYWRSVGGQEVDLVVEQEGGRIVACECKTKERPGVADGTGLRVLAKAEEGREVERVIVCRTVATYRLPDGTLVTGVEGLLELLE